LHRQIRIFLLFAPRDLQSIDSNWSTTGGSVDFEIGLPNSSRFQDAEKYVSRVKTPTGKLRSELAWANLRPSCRAMHRTSERSMSAVARALQGVPKKPSCHRALDGLQESWASPRRYRPSRGDGHQAAASLFCGRGRQAHGVRHLDKRAVSYEQLLQAIVSDHVLNRRKNCVQARSAGFDQCVSAEPSIACHQDGRTKGVVYGSEKPVWRVLYFGKLLAV
jgi:hypothetical protein